MQALQLYSLLLHTCSCLPVVAREATNYIQKVTRHLKPTFYLTYRECECDVDICISTRAVEVVFH